MQNSVKRKKKNYPTSNQKNVKKVNLIKLKSKLFKTYRRERSPDKMSPKIVSGENAIP